MADAEPIRVLLIYEPDGSKASTIEFTEGFHSRLDAPNPTAFEIYSEYLDSLRFPEPEHVTRMANLLSAKYRDKKLDVVIVLGPYALSFILDNREKIAPDAPLLFGGISTRSTRLHELPPDAKGILSEFDLRQTLSLAQRLQPYAKKAVVVFGSGPFDQSWGASAKAALGDRYLDFEIEYLTGLNLDGFADKVRHLRREDVVLLLTVSQDAQGRKYDPREVTAKLAPISSVPLYTVYDTFVAAGALGGQMGTFRSVGEQMADLVVKVTSQDQTLPQFVRQVSQPIVNELVMKRFNIDPKLLPSGSEILFHQTSAWEEYSTEIMLIIAVVLLQSGLITALVLQASHRRKIEAELALGQRELAHLSRASMLGELSGAFAHELNQPLTSMLANAEVGKRLLNSPMETGKLGELKEIFSDIIADNKRAADVIIQLRRLLTKGEASLEPVELSQVVNSTLALANAEFVVRQTKVNFKRPSYPVEVLGNFAQLQQIVLNLVVNAMDATSTLPPANRQVEIVVRKDGRFGELIVLDNGPGLTPDMMNDAFKPFVSTKPGGLGLGLQICHSIATAHGGTLAFDEGYHRGARIVLRLPLQE